MEHSGPSRLSFTVWASLAQLDHFGTHDPKNLITQQSSQDSVLRDALYIPPSFCVLIPPEHDEKKAHGLADQSEDDEGEVGDGEEHEDGGQH